MNKNCYKSRHDDLFLQISISHRALLSHHSIAEAATVLVFLQRVHTEGDQTAAAATT